MKNTAFPNMPQAILYLFCILVATFFGSIVMMALLTLLQVKSQVGLIWAMAITNLLVLGGGIGVGVLLAQRPVAKVLPLAPVRWVIVLVIVVTMIGIQSVLSEVDNLIRLVLPMPEGLAKFFESLTHDASLWASIFALVIMAPLTEELLLRGVVLQGFLRHYRPALAIFYSALLFGLMHLNPWQFFTALPLGMMFGWMTLRTRSLYPALLSHAVANGLPLVVVHSGLYVPWLAPQGSPMGPPVFAPWWFDTLAVIVMVAGLVLLHRLMPSMPLETTSDGDAAPTIPDPPAINEAE